MSPIYAYENEPYQTSLEVEILTIGDEAGRAFAVLDNTILYPEGGGQPADQGQLQRAAAKPLEVTDVQRVDGKIRHYLAHSTADVPVATGPATLELDWRRRFDHMQQHTAQHLVTAVAERRFGWKTTSFHLQPEVCDIELDAKAASPKQLETLEDTISDEVRANRPLTTRRVTPQEYGELEVRSRGLPADHQGDVRLVEIEGVDCNTCGGTHLRSTGEIETVKLLGVEPARGGLRLKWIAGGRVRRRLEDHERRSAELRNLLGASDDELAGIAGLKLEQLKQATRHAKMLTVRLAEAAADALIHRRQSAVAEHFDGVDASFLRIVAQRISATEHDGAALLTASSDKGSFFAVAAGGVCTLDVQQAGRKVAEMLTARGGGSGHVFQGKAESLERRAEAAELLAALFRDGQAR